MAGLQYTDVTTKKLEDQAASAALSSSHKEQQRRPSVLDEDGKLSSASAATSLKYAKAQDLPSFPSAGLKMSSAGAAASLADANKKNFEHWKPGAIPAANRAAMLAKDYEMDPLWQPEMSAAGSKAAIKAHKDTESPEIWRSQGTAQGQSAAGQALKTKMPDAITDRNVPADGHRKAMLAATGAMANNRARSGSLPANTGDNKNWALKAATSSHQGVPNAGPFAPGDPGFEASRIQNQAKSNVNRQMYGSTPPVALEVEEKNRQDTLRASAIAMAKKMYAIQQSAIDEAAGRKNDSRAAATSSHQRDRSDSIDTEEVVAPRYENLEEAARKLAQERLAKLHDEHAEYRQYYGAAAPSTRSRFSVRSRRRTSSGARDLDSSDDEQQSRRIKKQMSLFQSKLADVDDKKRQSDRDALLQAAQRNVDARMAKLDEKVFQETGKASPAQQSLWEQQARERAQKNSDVRMENVGKVHIGGGKYLDQSEIDAIAKARLQPTLDEMTETAERQRARDEEIRLDHQRAQEQLAKEKAREAEVKAETKAAQEVEKAEARKKKDEEKRVEKEKAAAAKEAARKEKEEKEAAAAVRKAEAQAEKDRVKAEAAAKKEAAKKEKEEKEAAAAVEKAKAQAEKDQAKAEAAAQAAAAKEAAKKEKEEREAAAAVEETQAQLEKDRLKEEAAAKAAAAKEAAHKEKEEREAAAAVEEAQAELEKDRAKAEGEAIRQQAKKVVEENQAIAAVEEAKAQVEKDRAKDEGEVIRQQAKKTVEERQAVAAVEETQAHLEEDHAKDEGKAALEEAKKVQEEREAAAVVQKARAQAEKEENRKSAEGKPRGLTSLLRRKGKDNVSDRDGATIPAPEDGATIHDQVTNNRTGSAPILDIPRTTATTDDTAAVVADFEAELDNSFTTEQTRKEHTEAIASTLTDKDMPTSPNRRESKVKSWFKNQFMGSSKSSKEEEKAVAPVSVASAEKPRDDSIRDVAMAGKETDDLYGAPKKDKNEQPVSPIREAEAVKTSRSSSVSSYSVPEIRAADARPLSGTEHTAQVGKAGMKAKLMKKIKSNKDEEEQPRQSFVTATTTDDDDDQVYEEAKDRLGDDKLVAPPTLTTSNAPSTSRTSHEHSRFKEEL